MYRDADIFSQQGITKFLEDAARTEDYLMHQAFGVDLPAARAEIKSEDQ